MKCTEKTTPNIHTCRLRVFSKNKILDTKSGSPSTCNNEQNVYFNEQPEKVQYDFEFDFKYSVAEAKNKFRGKTFAVPIFGVVNAKLRISKQNITTSII